MGCKSLERAFSRKGKSTMLNSVEGFYRHGKIEFTELPPAELEGKVIVTFLTSGAVDLAERGIDQEQAADLRGRLKTMAADWDRPEMDVYDAV
jgi:hypothetical protein